MNSKERASLIEKVALKWKEKGIEELKIYGNFQKYSPIFHFHISEPYAFGKDENFIFITELFGHDSLTPEIKGFMNFTGMRRQLHGNYKGLNQIILHGITEPNFKPFEIERKGIGKMQTTLFSPSRNIMKPEKEDYKLFDNALLYLEHITEYSTPKTFKLDSGYEFLSSTHNI